jgi:hypothetical protein
MTNGTESAARRCRSRLAGRLAVLTATAGLAPAAALSAGQAQAAPHPAVVRGQVAAGTIATVAGGVGGPARATRMALFEPCGVTYSAGSVYAADGLALRKINPRTDWLTTPAGNGISGPAFDGLLANRASIGTCTVAFDRAGNAVLPNAGSNIIQVVAASTGTSYGRVMTAGHIYTVAGSGVQGFSGDGGPAAKAELSSPSGADVDGAGNLLIADTRNERVRVEAASTGTFYGQAMIAGDIYTVAGNGNARFSGDGGPATKAGLFDPQVATVDGAGNLLIADRGNNRIRVVAVRTGTFYGRAMTAGDIYTVAGGGNDGLGDGGPATKAGLEDPPSVAVDGTGNLIIADETDCRIRVVAVRTGTFYGQAMTAGDIYTVAGTGVQGFSGDGGPATKAEVNFPFGADVDGAGNLLIADSLNYRLRVVAVRTGTFYGQAMTAGDIYTVAGTGIARYFGDGGRATKAQLYQPGGVTVDRAGNWLIADTGNNRIRVVAAATGTFYGRPMTAGDIYTVAGTGAQGFSGDGGPAVKAGLYRPGGVRADRAGNLLIADTYDNRIRVVAVSTGTFYGRDMTAGDIYTVAGNGGTGHTGDGGPAVKAAIKVPGGVAIDHSGNLVIAGGYGNNRVRVVAETTGTFYGQQMTAGDIYTVAGGGSGELGDGIPATSAQLNDPGSVAVDHAGNLVISDEISWRIRVVAASTGTFYGQQMTAGDIYTVAGGGDGVGDSIPATDAHLPHPAGVAVDRAGNILIAALHDSRIRVAAAATGTFYGRAMTAGDIYTVAGGGKGRVEDGGPATGARLLRPRGVAVGPAGSLVIADTDNGLIRTVTG